MKDIYSRGDWRGQVSQEGDLLWGLDNPPGPVFEVGQGNVLYLSGWCFHRTHRIKNIRIALSQSLNQTCQINITRRDISKMFRDKGLEGNNIEQCGFRCFIPIEKLSEDLLVDANIEATLYNGDIIDLFLGEITLSSENPDTHELSSMRESARELVARNERNKGQAHVMICLATFNPNLELFQNQIFSICNQTYQNWTCIINDDFSEPCLYDGMQKIINGDDRFLVFRNEKNLGFYKNFERLLYLVPDNADLVALSDQDDYWFCDKLERLAGELDEGTTLVYSDMRIVRADGKVLSNTFWTTRENYYKELDYLVLVNTITGAASAFRRSLISYILPFPENTGNSYHDQWIGCIASALGDIKYIDEPLYDYYQHGDNVLGHSTFSKRGLIDRIRPLKNIFNMQLVRESMIFYQQVFDVDGVRSVLIASNILVRAPNISKHKNKEISIFSSLISSSTGLVILAIRTMFNKKTTSDAERYLLKSYWSDKIIRLGILDILL
jgi:glycosyltransferase involved in cell wall biosynthesis